METHLNNLKNLCRICGKTIILKAKYKNPKSVLDYKEEIERCCNILVAEEDGNIYPKLFCHPCHHRFYKIKREQKFTQISTVSFTAHCSRCEVCFIRTSPPSKAGGGIKSLHVKEMDKKLETINFNKIEHDDESLLRSYWKECDGISVRLLIKQDFTWKCDIMKQFDLPQLPNGLPVILNDTNLSVLVQFFESTHLCKGIQGFHDVLAEKLEIRVPFKDSEVFVETVLN